MEPFTRRIKLNREQRKEVNRYLGSVETLSEFTILKIVRKLKLIEQKLGELKYE